MPVTIICSGRKETIKLKIINQTKNTVLVENGMLAQTFTTRAKGLLGRKFLQEGSGLLIKPCNQIHSIGMKFPFDAIFLDKNLVVCHIESEIKPSNITKLVRGARSVLEVPAGKIAATQTQVGDQLKIEE